jgi:hypothetical protein
VSQGHSGAGSVKPIKKYNEEIGDVTRNIPACTTVDIRRSPLG